MQAGTKIIAMQVRDLKIQQTEGMRAINNHLNTVQVCHLAYLSYRHNLAYPVNNMGYMYQFGFWGDGILISLHYLLIVLYREIKAQLFINNPFAQRTLLISANHMRVILFGTDHLIAFY